MKLYCDKTRARYAAKRELAKGFLGGEPREGIDFEIVAQDGKFGWVVPAPVQAPAADFEPVDYPEAGGDAAEARATRKQPIGRAARKVRKARGTAENPVFGVPFIDPAEDPTPAEDLPEPAAELPTSFAPDAEAGEVASAEYGMLTTRERAGEAAKAAGVSDPVISQTARGMWVWRTPALNQVWRESQKPPRNPETAEREPGQPRMQAKTVAAFEAARRGELPAPPDFSADTHKPYRKRLEELRQLVKAGDLEALRAYPIKPTSTSPKALDRYRNCAVLALEAIEEKRRSA